MYIVFKCMSEMLYKKRRNINSQVCV